VDLDSGALVAVTLQGAESWGHDESSSRRPSFAAEQVEAAQPRAPPPAALTEIVRRQGLLTATRR